MKILLFLCLSVIIGASTNQEDVKKDNPVTFFCQAFLCKLLKKMSCSDFALPVM